MEMKAIVQTRYGLRGLRIMDAPIPVPGEHQVLVRVHAAALNYAVMFRVTGKPFLARLMMGSLLSPKRWIPGGEMSGRVGADPWVLAQAKADSIVVVTHEVLVPPNSKRVKIPNVCSQFGVLYVDTYTILRQTGASFS
jgi:NADPH:quinone reductase-like Zn-dependent oxidoreductase